MAKPPTFMHSITTSVIARAVCCCFCAIRPAKSSSKKLSACPIVCRCSRDMTSGNRFTPNESELNPPLMPMRPGRMITKNTASRRNLPQCAANSPTGPCSVARSMAQPIKYADKTSERPTKTDTNNVIAMIGHAPDRHHWKKAPSVAGGWPFARAKASMRREKCIGLDWLIGELVSLIST